MTSSAYRSRVFRSTRHFRPVLLLVVVMFVAFSITLPNFFDGANLVNLLTSVAVLGIVSMGMTLVTIVGGFDLSVGAVASLSAIGLVKLLAAGVPGWLAVVLCVVGGLALGGITNGALVGRLHLSFFVVTLATMTAFTGFVNIWSNTQTTNITDPFVTWLGIGSPLGIPTPIWIMVIVFGITLYVQNRTLFGRDIYAIGGSITAARLSGIRTTRTVIFVYAIVAGTAALGGIIAAGRVGAASPQVDATLPLQAAAAVLLGGTALTGGSGGVGGTALGVIFIGVLQNGLSIAGLQSFWQQVATGVILIAAVFGNQVFVGSARSRTVEKPTTPLAQKEVV